MSKVERGLPKSFDIKVSKGPVDLGDYLDDPPAAARSTPAPLPATVPGSVAVAPERTAPEPAVAAGASQPVWTPSAVVDRTPVTIVPNEPAVRRSTRGKQRQFNMAPEALRMLEEVLVYLRANSPERDLRASEVMHGLVLALHSAVPHMDLTMVPQRGKWGSPSATALPHALKQVFERAFRKS